mmetsp:Transcript_128156/g.190973  ORF Transcript_128156/g.190973 Transcript_128156/m.190973 type:complete len:236 (+) Transcript_128156:452-1159(+)
MLRSTASSLRSFSLRTFLSPPTRNFRQEETSENFCFTSSRNECAILESINTDWSLILSNQSRKEYCSNNFMAQLFVSLLATNPLSTPIVQHPNRTGTLIGILKKEPNQISPSTEKIIPTVEKLSVKLTESSDINTWTFYCHTDPTITKALERALQTTIFPSSSKIEILSSDFVEAKQVEVKIPVSELNGTSTKNTVDLLSSILSHPEMLPFTTNQPKINPQTNFSSRPKVEKLCL